MIKPVSLFFLCVMVTFAHAQGSLQSKNVKSIAVYAIDPHIVESFARIGSAEILNNENGRFYKLITSPAGIKDICTLWNNLSHCHTDTMDCFSARIVLKLTYTSGKTVYAILGDMIGQELYTDGYYCKPNAAFYRKILQYLPGKWRRGIHPRSNKLCDPVGMWGG